jgi:hypothetical protein
MGSAAKSLLDIRNGRSTRQRPWWFPITLRALIADSPVSSLSPRTEMLSVPTLKFSILLLEFLDPAGVRTGHPGACTLLYIGLAHTRPHRLDPVPHLADDPPDRPVFAAQLLAQRPENPHRRRLLLRAVAARRRLNLRFFLRGRFTPRVPAAGLGVGATVVLSSTPNGAVAVEVQQSGAVLDASR